MRGLCLARVSARDVSANERRLSGYRQYVKDHPEDARRYGIRQPHELSEGQLVLVDIENGEPWIYLFSEVLTATERRELREYILSLDSSGLPDIASAAKELQMPLAQPEEPKDASETQWLRLRDLVRRWGYSRQGVQKLIKRPDFPPPCLVLDSGRKRLWAAKDIENYERDRPELHSEAAKILKVKAFARALRKGRQQPSA